MGNIFLRCFILFFSVTAHPFFFFFFGMNECFFTVTAVLESAVCKIRVCSAAELVFNMTCVFNHDFRWTRNTF